MKNAWNFILALLIGSICIVIVCVIWFNKETESNPKKESNEWFITQYGRNDVNLSFYSLYNEENGLILVDGGWVEDANIVRDVIDELGGHVDAWILTHPHQDHIGAFSSIYSDLQGISIDTIYTVDMATPEECLKTAPWDSIQAYQDFLALDVKNIQYLYSGDTIEICGLRFEIFSAFDENVRNLSTDYLNDGSMMFKVVNDTESMLFCADVGGCMSDYLINEWGEKLQADYIQMGHHGYGGLSDDFYRIVNPQIAFFDAPDWLMYDESGKYDNLENIRFMKSIGCEIYSFNSAPNSIPLK